MASRNNFGPAGGAGNQANRKELLGGPTAGSVSRAGVSNGGYASPSSPTRVSGPGAVGGMSEMDQINMKINKTTDESLESTRRMLGLVEESQEVGVRTMENLYKQGEQLDKVEENLDKMNQDMKEAEKNMEQMEKCCGLCVCPWNKSRNFEKSSGFQKTYGKKAPKDGMGKPGDTIMMEQPNVDDFNRDGGRIVQRITNDAREDEMEENLGAVGNMLGGLKMMATDMGKEINKQNKQLDSLNQKAEVTDVRVVQANKRANDILRKA
ncbi:hypothetical protein RvY_06645 [Ramazzottius varieornatus]|uniref:Synaptosomal-associated protein n=1 Tax=Ramazzottius varieornatus TaxID=947166 RepID=A0A1D1UZA4_RAMVA|nr:hypothetical protein RvY_06645 [Ramazzottius varieornatus]